MGWQDAPVVNDGGPQPAWMSAPVVGAESAAKPSLGTRIKNALIEPEATRDASFGESVKQGLLGIPAAIGKDFMENARQFGRDIAPKTKEDAANAGPVGFVPKELLDVGGMAMSPLTGALTSAIGRPIEQQTGLRRGIVGNALSMAVPFGGEAKTANVALDVADAAKSASAVKPMAVEAHAAGYVLPPKMVSDKPGVVANTLAGWSGKIKTAQAASAKNQEVTNALAAKSLGLDPEAGLSPQVFKQVRADAGKAYAAIPEALPQVKADDDYMNIVSNLARPGSEAAQRAFPNITKNQGIIDLQDEMSSVKDFPTGAGIEIVKELRKQATANLKNFADPSKAALGDAQRRGADAVDDLIQRNLEQTGNEKLVDEYKAARQQIAKSHDIESATNPATGNVDARKIAALAKKGRPLSGELDTIAKVAAAFPKAFQSAEKFGEVEPLSVLDLGGAAITAAHGNVGVAGAILGRPLARAAVLSNPVQKALMAERWATGIPLTALRRAPAVNALYQGSAQTQQ